MDTVVKLIQNDVPGAKLNNEIVEKNSGDSLRRWLAKSEFGKIIKSFINLAFNEASGLIPRHLEMVPIASQRSQ
jgi:hypothetical protein